MLFFGFYFIFFSLWLARAWEEFHGLVNSSGRWSNAPPPSVTPRVGPHLSSYVTSWHTSQLPTFFPWAGMFSCLMGLMVGPFCYFFFSKGQSYLNFFFWPDTSIFCWGAVCYFANVHEALVSQTWSQEAERYAFSLGVLPRVDCKQVWSGKWILSTSGWWTLREAPGAWHKPL